MTRLALALAVVVPALASGQGKAVAVPDAGVPARLDAGVALEKPAVPVAVPVVAPPPPAPAAPPGPTATELELARLRRDVLELKLLLEKQLAQSDGVASSVDRLGKQVGQLKAELADAEQRRVEEKRQAAARREATSQAVAGLAAAQQQLAGGGTDIGYFLSQAEASFTGSALRAVQSARAALANNDLNATRYWLAVAAAEAANQRD